MEISQTVAYLAALMAALIYAFASLNMKRCVGYGVGALRTFFITNYLFFLTLSPCWVFETTPAPEGQSWLPVVLGIITFMGALLGFLSIKHGDISVATPLLGTKVIFVAAFSSLFLDDAVPLSWWVAAGLTVIAVALFRKPGRAGSGGATWLTVLLALSSSACFAGMEVIIAGWGQSFGFFRLVILQHGIIILLSLGLIPWFREPLWEIPEKCWYWVLGAGVLMVIQFLLLNGSIAFFGNPTALNVIYSTRGLWTLLLVWWIGHHFDNHEKEVGRDVLYRRAIGTVSLLTAVILVVATDA